MQQKRSVNFNVLKDYYRQYLVDILDSVPGQKVLVWDETLTGVVGYVAEYSLLKDHGVEKMYNLKKGRVPLGNAEILLFIVRPRCSLMEIIADNIQKEISATGPKKKFHVVFVPRRSVICEKTLKELGVNITDEAMIRLSEFPLDCVMAEQDVLSMEWPFSFRELAIDQDYTCLFHSARAIMYLQSVFGTIPNIYGKGEWSKQVCDLVLRMRRESVETASSSVDAALSMNQIDNLILIDRSVDPLTPLLTQLTYEGLVDEVIGIRNSTVKIASEKLNPTNKSESAAEAGSSGASSSSGPATKSCLLTAASDDLFGELRDLNFSAVAGRLSRKAKQIAALEQERHSARNVTEMREFVSKIPLIQQSKQQLTLHTTMAEMIKEMVDSDTFLDALRIQQDFINMMDTDKVNTQLLNMIIFQSQILPQLLRLLCVQSFVNGGLKQKTMEQYKNELVHSFGYGISLWLRNLEKTDLLRTAAQPTKNFATFNKSLRLLVDNIDEQKPNDAAYVFSGYAPLSVRLVQFLAKPGWRAITELLQRLPGPVFEEHQLSANPSALQSSNTPAAFGGDNDDTKSAFSGLSGNPNATGSDDQVTLVFFVGGVTYAEIAALRFLSQLEDWPTEYLVATTRIINGESWLKELDARPSPLAPSAPKVSTAASTNPFA